MLFESGVYGYRAVNRRGIALCAASRPGQSGNVEAGTVYHTDALISKKVKIACEVPPNEGPKITYPIAVLKESRYPDAAKKLLAFLYSGEARTLFQKYGFRVLN